MIGLEFDETTNLYYPIYRHEVPRHEFTLSSAVRHIVESDKAFHWDYIIVDRGYGEGQVEELHRYGIMHPESGFAKKVIGIAYNESVTTIDPYLKRRIKYPMKSFMVLQTALAFEKQKFAVVPDDYKLIKRLEDYRFSSTSQYGQPIFDDKDDHLFLAMSSAYYGYVKYYSDLMKRNPATKILPIKSPLQRASEEEIDRGVDLRKPKKKSILFGTPQRKTRGNGIRRTSGVPKRSFGNPSLRRM